MADIKDGDSVEVKGFAVKPYVLRKNGGVYSCSRPAWSNKSAPIEKRTCKHLKKFRSEAAEVARNESAEQQSVPKSVSKAANAERDVQVLLASNSGSHMAPTAWWMREKLDGVRALWDGKRFLSRQGNEFSAPDWYVQALPDTKLDGEPEISILSQNRRKSISFHLIVRISLSSFRAIDQTYAWQIYGKQQH